MRSTIILAAIIGLLPASAQAMPAGEFLAKADALRAKGPFALLSGDYRLLKDAWIAASAQLRQDRLAALEAHKPPAYCPSAGKESMDADELIGTIRSMPPALRAKSELKDAMRVLLIRKHPCPA